jgi:MiaB/RimO family radical SAM methylthiotransferase
MAHDEQRNVKIIMPKVYVTTNGCDEGQLKSMHVQQFFIKNGFAVTTDPTQADFVVFYACGLTTPQEKHSLLMIRWLQAQTKDTARFIVWGCLTKQNPKCLAGTYSGPLIGPRDMDFFENLLDETVVAIDDVSANALVPQETTGLEEVYPKMAYDPIFVILRRIYNRMYLVRLPRRKYLFDPDSFFVRVAEGCTGSCSYCSERPAWGRVKSRPMQKIIEEFKWGLQKGYNRFFLAAADLGSYGVDIGCNVVDLLKKLVTIDERRNYQMILNQMNPADLKRMLPELEEVLASGKIEALGCQVESGSDRILELMGRKYSASDWRESMLEINRKFPFVRLSTHFMIGFPTETDQDFEATLKLLDFPIFIDWVGLFIFSPRPTVYASCLPGQVPEKIKEQRFKKIYRKYLYMYILNVAIGNIRYILGSRK